SVLVFPLHSRAPGNLQRPRAAAAAATMASCGQAACGHFNGAVSVILITADFLWTFFAHDIKG
ncbi:Riboflavin biosynthesis protein RibBA, partial [Clarias magur]